MKKNIKSEEEFFDFYDKAVEKFNLEGCDNFINHGSSDIEITNDGVVSIDNIWFSITKEDLNNIVAFKEYLEKNINLELCNFDITLN